MFVSILLLLVGLGLIVFGADWLVDGASAVARRAGISEFVIGLTIVGFGTSCPELVVSLTGALQGNADISVGNVVGSNIFNVMLILGITALLFPVAISPTNSKRDIPMTLLVTIIFVALASSSEELSLAEGIVFLVIFALYLFYCFKFDTGADRSDNASESGQKEIGPLKAVVLIFVGLAGLIFGGRLFVDNAVVFAKAVGVSDKFIAITILAGGTSLPELATCIVAAAKHKGQFALGNILGSNVFNILLILGCSTLIRPLSTVSMTIADYGVLLVSTVLPWLWTYTGSKRQIDRWEGVVLILCYVAYMVLLSTKL